MRYFLYGMLLLMSMLAGCVSIKKEGKTFVVQIKAISPETTPEETPATAALYDMGTRQHASPAATSEYAPSTALLYDMSTGQPAPLNNTPAQFRNKAFLRWEGPTTNADGTPLHDLDGYKIYYDQTENSLDAKDRMRINVTTNATSIIMYNLLSGRWCFQVTAYDTYGNESEFSNRVCENAP